MGNELSVFPVKDRGRNLFGPGNNANPAGRDGKLKVRMLRYGRGKSLKAIRILCEIMEDVKNPVVVRKDAAIAVLNRAWGAPRQEIEIADAGATLEEMLTAIWREKQSNINIIDHDDEPSVDGMASEVYNDEPSTE